MATYTKNLLSSSVNGKSIVISGTASLEANTVHTAVAGTTNLDEIWLYAHNTDSTQRKLTIEWGTAAPSASIEQTIPAEAGAYLCVPGWLLNNSMVVKAFAETASVVSVNGYVNSITA